MPKSRRRLGNARSAPIGMIEETPEPTPAPTFGVTNAVYAEPARRYQHDYASRLRPINRNSPQLTDTEPVTPEEEVPFPFELPVATARFPERNPPDFIAQAYPVNIQNQINARIRPVQTIDEVDDDNAIPTTAQITPQVNATIIPDVITIPTRQQVNDEIARTINEIGNRRANMRGRRGRRPRRSSYIEELRK